MVLASLRDEREGLDDMPEDRNANQNRPQLWWAKLLKKIGLGSFVKRSV